MTVQASPSSVPVRGAGGRPTGSRCPYPGGAAVEAAACGPPDPPCYAPSLLTSAPRDRLVEASRPVLVEETGWGGRTATRT